MHYTRWSKFGDPGPAEPQRADNGTNSGECAVDECTTRAHARGWCPAHWNRWRLYGDPLGVASPREPRKLADLVADIEAGRGGTTGAKGYRYYSLNGVVKGAHRWVMEHYLGRELLRSEEVHHRNGDKSDNSLGNLELWDTSHPAGQRIEDKLAHARTIIERYGDYVPPQ